jgi:tetratricopeptide (TPR) repeat protein
MKSWILGTLTLIGLVGPLARTARAEDCPEQIPSSSRERRSQAKDWFSRGEAADAAGDPVAAVKAYQCSLKMVPHAYTAFNLGRLAERSGDLELAVEAFGAYLKLAPEAQDKTEIEAKITALTSRIAAARPDPTRSSTGARPEPAPVEAATAPQRTLSDEPMVHETQPVSKDEGGGGRVSPLVYVLGGVGAAGLVGGIVLNIGARSKMDDCRNLASGGDLDGARSACDAAKPRAYASYALFGVAAAAAVADAVILVTASKHESHVSVAPLPDGALALARFRF